MTEDLYALKNHRLRSPRAAAIAGIIFSVLYSFSFILIRLAVPTSLTEQIVWVEAQRENVELALRILPFAGIAFIWFIAVIRERLGRLEDRFFSTIFIGSGLLYLAMSYSAAAIAGGVIITYALVPDFSVDTTSYVLNRAII
jgi:drug/metabolite transporter (DMT)-like permease